MSAPSAETVHDWLREVHDPEIPALSVIDLGIVRGVRHDADDLVVEITPTYSGCPAMHLIEAEILAALTRRGVARARVEVVLREPWSTDWISAEGRRRLQAAGIAPPARCVRAATPFGHEAPGAPIPCPLCGSAQTESISPFGSTPCKALRRCLSCRQPFEALKPL